MRILAISPTGGLSGVDQTFRYLCAGLVQRGAKVVAVIPQDAAIKQSLLDAEVEVEEARHLHWWFNPGFADHDAPMAAERSRVNVRLLLRLIRSQRPDVVISNTSVMLDGVLASIISGTAHVTHLHALFVDNIYTQMSARFKASIYELLAGPSSEMIVPARETRDQLLKLIPDSSPYIHAVPNGVDLVRFSVPEIRNERPEKIRILSLGHFNANKNQLLLVDVARELERRGIKNFIFVLAGPPEALYLSLLKKKIAEQKMTARFQILDSQDDVLPFLHGAHIYTNCSITETFPVSVLEAMATGLPVVCTSTVGAREIVVDGRTGLLADDNVSLADQFVRLINDADYRLEVGRAARARIEELYSVDSFVEKFLEVVERKAQAQVSKPANWLESVYFGRPQGANFDKVLRVAALIPDRTQTSYDLLIKKPFDQIRENNVDISFEVFSYGELSGLRLDEVDILYVFRIYANPIPELVEQARSRGIRVIFESDDNYFALKFENGSPVHGEYKNIALENLLALANQVIVYSSVMEDQARCFAESVVRLRPFQLAPYVLPTPPAKSGAVIGFMGSLKKDVDFEFVVPAILQLLSERPELRIEFFGFVPVALEGHPRVDAQAFDPNYDEFTLNFRQRAWTVGLAPLADTLFNRSKTNNKYREYAAAGYASIYSDIPPYADCVVDGVSGLLVENSPEAWYGAISRLLDDTALRSAIRRNAFRDVKKNYRFEEHVSTKLEILREVARLELGATLDDLATLRILDAPPERHWTTPRKRLSRHMAIDVANVPFRSANIGTYRGQLCAVEVIVTDFVTAPESMLGIEIVYENEIVDHMLLPLTIIQRGAVTRFFLNRPLLVTRDIEIRVFGRSVFGPIKVAGYAGLPKLQKKPVLFLVGRKV